MTIATPTGRTLQLPPPAPADLAAAMAEACIRLALARIKQGELDECRAALIAWYWSKENEKT